MLHFHNSFWRELQEGKKEGEGYWVACSQSSIKSIIINSLRAKLRRGNINIYLHFMSLLHIYMTQVLKVHSK